MPALTSLADSNQAKTQAPLRRSKASSSSTSYRDNAESIVPIKVDPQSESRDDQLRQVATIVCPFLADEEENSQHPEVPVKDAKSSDLLVRPLQGGLSNELFIVSKPGVQCVLVRIHPKDGTDTGNLEVVDREVENHLVAWLSREGMAPIFYGRFENGRVEELYPNVAPLTAFEMPAYGAKIATAMADFHALQAPCYILPKPRNGIPHRFQTIDQWVQGIRQPTNRHTELSNRIQSEWKWLRAQLLMEPATGSSVRTKALKFIREIVLTHMDVQSLNVLKDSNATNGQGNIRLIDFEYAGWNPRAADVANTFCEHCDMNNLCADYPAEYPSVLVQNDFLKAYLQQLQVTLAETKEEEQLVLEALRSEIGRFSLLSHLGWATWSVVMALQGGSDIDFDYIAYAKHRLDGFDFGKNLFFNKSEC